MFVLLRVGTHCIKFGSGCRCWKDEIWLCGGVTPKTADTIENYLETTPYEKVSMFINSGGGDASAMDRIIDAIEKFNRTKQLDTYCIGMVASSAFEIFLCGKERIIDETSQLMYHDAVVDFSPCGSVCWTIRELQDKVRSLEVISKASRIWVAHHTGLSVRALKRMTKHHKEKWFTIDECMKYKIATKVLDN